VKKVGFIYDDVFLRHETPEGHPERKRRLIQVISVLQDSGLWDSLIYIKPRKADYEDVALVHDREYIEKIRNFTTGYLDPDTYVSEDTAEAALYAAGALIEAVERCKKGEIERAFCAVRPPGHHAESNRAMGFCIFNNVAIGARYGQKIGYRRIFIIDFDVHHGNGTQRSFEDDNTVFYFSTHQHPYYPGTGGDSERGVGKGQGYTYNVPMQAGAGDNDYLYVYENILPDLVKKFIPDIILVSAGYDIHKYDPLSNIRVSNEGLRSVVRSILSCATRPVVFALEGGYDLNSLAQSVKITIEEMLGNNFFL
jgi:acetoin utilization deacetylase AcuC-like enzyme